MSSIMGINPTSIMSIQIFQAYSSFLSEKKKYLTFINCSLKECFKSKQDFFIMG